MIRIAPVNYTNTYPLIYHLPKLEKEGIVKVQSMIPSAIPIALQEGSIDLGLAPIGGLSMLSEYHIVGNYGIGTDGPVASVCLFADQSIEDLEYIYLDYQSRTSVKLLKWLIKNHYNKDIKYIQTSDDSYISQITGNTGGLIIGDRAFDQLSKNKYCYDLGEIWKEATGLPFVFAVWVSKYTLDPDFIHQFDELQAQGLKDIHAVIEHYNLQNASYDMEKYYTQNISYQITDRHRQSMEMFLKESNMNV